VEPVESSVLGRFITTWQGTTRPRTGLDPLLDAVEHLQGAPLPASILEPEILPARVADYDPADLDTLIAAGEVVWVGIEPLGDRDGRLSLYLTDHLPRLWRPRASDDEVGATEQAILDALGKGGAAFFPALHEAAGGGYPGETLSALWNLVWRGLVTNDSLHALRSFVRPPARNRRMSQARAFRSRRTTPASGEGRWSLVEPRAGRRASDTEWTSGVAQQLLTRYGIVTREVAAAEGLVGGFSGVYEVFRTLEERGRLRRGFFAAGVGATQFALPAALDLLRSLRSDPEEPEAVRLAATDPANPYGAILKWPDTDSPLDARTRGATRSVGATVILVNGALAAYAGRQGRSVLSYLPPSEPERSQVGRSVAAALARLAGPEERAGAGLLVAEINGQPVSAHPLTEFLLQAGFVPSALGLRVPRGTSGTPAASHLPANLERARARPARPLRSSPFAALRPSHGRDRD
jgi:ATP-dependent Lhr-like helicase